MLLIEKSLEKMPNKSKKSPWFKKLKPTVFRFSTTPMRTGIELEPQFFRFIKQNVESELRDKLHVEILSNQRKANREIFLVGTKEKPNKFGEAKALIRKAVRMTQNNWKEIQRKISKKTPSFQIVDLEENSCVEETSVNLLPDAKDNTIGSSSGSPGSAAASISGNDTLSGLKDIVIGSPSEEVLGKNQTSDGLCVVVMDTQGGASHSGLHNIDINLSGTLYEKKNDSSKAKILPVKEENLSEPSGSQPDTTFRPTQGGEDFILISSPRSVPKKRDVMDETIVIGDDTILISSEDESEEDILIEKVVEGSSASPMKLRSLSAGSSPTTPSNHPKTLKRKLKVSSDPCQRNKICKRSDNTDVSKMNLLVLPLAVNPYHLNGDKGKLPKKIQSLSVQKGSATKSQHTFDKNVVPPVCETTSKTGLRPIIIDGCNVGNESRIFKFNRLEICIKYFQGRQHKVIAFIPRNRQGMVTDEERAKMRELEEEKILCFTPTRRTPDGKLVASYDDRFIVQAATELGGIIVSNDNFRDIINENERWKETIENRLLMYTWVGDMLMFPNDPLGRDGPHLDEFLRFPKEGD